MLTMSSPLQMMKAWVNINNGTPYHRHQAYLCEYQAIYLFSPVIPMLLQNMIFELFLLRSFTGANVIDLNKSRQRHLHHNIELVLLGKGRARPPPCPRSSSRCRTRTRPPGTSPPAPIRGEDGDHVTRSPPIPAHLLHVVLLLAPPVHDGPGQQLGRHRHPPLEVHMLGHGGEQKLDRNTAPAVWPLSCKPDTNVDHDRSHTTCLPLKVSLADMFIV